MYVDMSRVEIIGMKDVFMGVVDAVQDLGVLHIDDVSEKMKQLSGEHVTKMEVGEYRTDQINRLEEMRLAVTGMLSELEAPSTDEFAEEVRRNYEAIWNEDTDVMLDRIEKLLENVESATKELLEAKQSLEAEQSRLRKYGPIMEKVQPLARMADAMEEAASIALIIEKKYKNIIDYLDDEICQLTDSQCEVVSADVDEETTAALVIFSKKYLNEVHDFLTLQNVNQIRLPSELTEKPLEDALEDVHKRLKEIPAELEEVNGKLKDIASSDYAPLVAINDAISFKLESVKALAKFGQTDYVFVITGWVPTDKVDELKGRLEDEFGSRVTVEVTEVEREMMEEEGAEPPTAIENRPIVKHFEALYLLSKFPRYGTVDPTTFFAIFFPIMFGLMLGDIGYGLVILVVAVIVRRKYKDKPMVQSIGAVLQIAAAWTIFFGILYLELFGTLLEDLFHKLGIHLPLLGTEDSVWKFPINRMEAFTFMLFAVCAVGLLHLTVSLTIGIVNGARERDYGHIMEKVGALGFLYGLTVMVISFRYLPKYFAMVGAGMMIAGVVLAGIGAGMGGLIETIVAAGNILSYSRLLAIGLASVIMAKVANDLAAELGGGGAILGTILGVILAIILHSINIVIGTFSPSIHSLRLHLVEGFTKFHEPAKEEYKPFRKDGGEVGE